MIIGIGTDIIETARIEKAMQSDGFRIKIYSEKEIEYCESKANKYESYAARFAAKEAFLKAIGTGWRGRMAFSEIGVLNDDLGKPNLHLTGEAKKIAEEMKVKSFHVSLSHVKEMAIATILLES